MPVIDRDGRVFGRFNLIDAAVAAFVVLLLPIGYATFLLFRPSRPVIDSVTRVEVTKEERRVAGGSLLTAKLKVKGSGFNPLLRAAIGSTSAMGFVFEDSEFGRRARRTRAARQARPGPVRRRAGSGAGARGRGDPGDGGPSVRVYGWLTGLTPPDAAALKPGLLLSPPRPEHFE